MITKKEIINSDRTLECPECGYICVGFKPVEYILCNPCLKEIEKKYYPIYWRIVTDNEDDIEIKDLKKYFRKD